LDVAREAPYLDASDDVFDAGPDVTPDAPPPSCPPARTPILVAAGLSTAPGRQLVLDDTNLYVVVDQRIMRFPKCGGPGEALTDRELAPGWLVLDGSSLYWGNGLVKDQPSAGALRTIATSGGMPRTLLTPIINPAPPTFQTAGVAVRGGRIFYGVDNNDIYAGTLYSAKLSGQDVNFVAQIYAEGLAVDDELAFVHLVARPNWSNPSPWYVGGIPHDKPPIPGVSVFAWIPAAQRGVIQVDGTGVYFTGWNDGEPAFVRASSKDGKVWKDLATNQGKATWLVLDDTYAYWMNEGASVMRVSKGGGPVESMADTVPVTGLGVDAASVYFATWDGGSAGGQLWRMDK
jgi:hypothetical protein